MQFSSNDSVDQARISNRDKSQPFVFPLNPHSTSNDDWTFLADKGTDFRVWFSRDQQPTGITSDSRSLALQIRSDIEENVKDKIVLTPLHTTSQGTIRSNAGAPGGFFQFDMMLAQDYQTPKFWLLHFQLLQCCGSNPPFVLEVRPSDNVNGPIVLQYGIRDDSTEFVPRHPERILFTEEVKRNHWYRFLFFLKPRPLGASEVGEIIAWINGRQLFDYLGAWGFTGRAGYADGIGLDLGIYRRRQKTVQTVFFDNVYFGRSRPSCAR